MTSKVTYSKFTLQLLGLFCALSCLALSPKAAAATSQEPLKTVPFVDVGKYLGDWYQISHIPMIFEGGTCVCARQRLTAGPNGTIKIYNSCNADTPAGRLRDISGDAVNEDPKTNARFSVDFHLGFRGSYWVIGLDPQYRFAVVSDKNEISLYILSKTPELSPELYQQALALAASQLDTSKVVMTEQKGCTYPK